MKPYASDLSHAEWAILEPLIPPAKVGGRPRSVNMRQITSGILYVLRSGGAWRLLPHDYPAWSRVYDYIRRVAQRRRLGRDGEDAAGTPAYAGRTPGDAQCSEY
jgi:transposase